MAKPPDKREGSRIIEALNQTSSSQHRSAEEERRAILEQAMHKQLQAAAENRAIIDRALNKSGSIEAGHRAIIERALNKARSIEDGHRATLQRALSQTHQQSLSQILLKLPTTSRTEDFDDGEASTDGNITTGSTE